MPFIYSAFTNNTPEAREWLEWLSYETYSFSDTHNYIVTVPLSSMRYGTIITEWAIDTFNEDDKYLYKDCIDCTDNLPLFKALTAVREDNDYMQWFTDGKKWILCLGDNFASWYYTLGTYNPFSLDTIHKATKEEIINHFNGFHHKSDV